MTGETFSPLNDKSFQDHFLHGITTSVIDLKGFSDTVLLEIALTLTFIMRMFCLLC